MKNRHTVLKQAQLRWTGHIIRMPDKRQFSVGNYRRERALKVARRNATKTSLKPLNDFNIPMGSGNCTGAVSSAMEQLSMKKRDSVTLKESVEND